MLHGEPKKRDFPALSAVMIVHAVVVVVSIKIKTVNQTEMSMAGGRREKLPRSIRTAQAVSRAPSPGQYVDRTGILHNELIAPFFLLAAQIDVSIKRDTC